MKTKTSFVTALILLVAFCAFSCTNSKSDNSTEQTQNKTTITDELNWEGKWKQIDNNPNNVFQIEISQKDDSLYLVCCGTQDEGKRIDYMQDDYSAIVKNPETNETNNINVKFAYSNAIGEASIKINNDTLFWNITRLPEGEIYCPQKATMVRSSD